MPRDAPASAQAQVAASGAHLYLVDGLIDDAGALVAALKAERGWFDVATLKEPYRVEGKKIMGFELAEQLDWHLPDAIVYPAGAAPASWACGRCLRNWRHSAGLDQPA
jgi:threonine synthase